MKLPDISQKLIHAAIGHSEKYLKKSLQHKIPLNTHLNTSELLELIDQTISEEMKILRKNLLHSSLQ